MDDPFFFLISLVYLFPGVVVVKKRANRLKQNRSLVNFAIYFLSQTLPERRKKEANTCVCRR